MTLSGCIGLWFLADSCGYSAELSSASLLAAQKSSTIWGFKCYIGVRLSNRATATIVGLRSLFHVVL